MRLGDHRDLKDLADVTKHFIGRAKTLPCLASCCCTRCTLWCHQIIVGTVAGRPVAGWVRVAHRWSGLDDGVGTSMMRRQDSRTGNPARRHHPRAPVTRRRFSYPFCR
jgi:hypothetical protein